MHGLKMLPIICFFPILVACAERADYQALDAQYPVVNIENGPVIGKIVGDSMVFQGIPYAQPPVKTLRWRPPQQMTAWQEALDTRSPSPACPQARHQDLTDENCLTLNVYAPNAINIASLPVLVWIHGGGYRSGTGAYYSSRNMRNPEEQIDATLWNRDGVILVTLNYRIGALGFFAHDALDPSEGANYGLMDIVAGLRWIHRNIKYFGGDKRKVTIMGGSAGGHAVQSLMVMPQAKGLFSAAISQSGYGTTALPRTKTVVSLTGSPSAEDVSAAIVARAITESIDPITAETLRAITASDLVNALDGYHYPIVDGITLLEEPGILFSRGRQHAVPYMSGGNSFDGHSYDGDEGLPPASLLEQTQPHTATIRMLYGIKRHAAFQPQVRQLFGDFRYVSAARYTAQQMALVDQPGYLYLLSYVPPKERHYWRGTPHSWQKRPLFRADNIPIINAMRQYIINLVKTGDPNGNSLPLWPMVKSANTAWMHFDEKPIVEYNLWHKKLDILQSVYEYRILPLVQQ
jgi:para-nitrobenzyl esterase